MAVIGRTEGDTVALIDVSDPPQAKVKEVLWRRANGPDVEPTYPIYSATTRPLHLRRRRGEGHGAVFGRAGQGRAGETTGAGGIRPEDLRPRLFAGRPVRPLLRPRPERTRGGLRRGSRPAKTGDKRSQER